MIQSRALFEGFDAFELHGDPVPAILTIGSKSVTPDDTHRSKGQVRSIGAVIHIEQRVRDLTGRLLAQEDAFRASDEDSRPMAFRVCDRLRSPLCSLSGQAGCQALFSRALNLAKAECPRLAALQIDTETGLKGLDIVEPGFTLEEARDAELALVAHLLQLLCTFVGEALTLRLVQGVWPSAVFDESGTGKEETP